jgi:hypothetical protein
MHLSSRDSIHRIIRVTAGVILSLAASLLAVEPGFPVGIRLPDKARGEAAIAALGARPPEFAAFYGKSPQQRRRLFQTDNSLWVDPEGRLR